MLNKGLRFLEPGLLPAQGGVRITGGKDCSTSLYLGTVTVTGTLLEQVASAVSQGGFLQRTLGCNALKMHPGFIGDAKPPLASCRKLILEPGQVGIKAPFISPNVEAT